MSADMAWGVTFLTLGAVYVTITALWCHLERRRRRSRPTWWERDMRHRQVERERVESADHIWNH